jgi:cytochrome c oxidase assembly protein subunit 11
MNVLKIGENLFVVKNFLRNISVKKTRNFSTSLLYRQNFQQSKFAKQSKKSAVLYTLSGAIIMAGFTYAAVPLYKMFCESTGFETKSDFKDLSNEELKMRMQNLKISKTKQIKVKFVANTSSDLNWSFEPEQSEVKLAIGETSLAFYRAKNRTNRPIVGIATYNILPFEAGLYFNKIQCFCFEEQRLEPGEEVDMPVFFYIDNEFCNDPLLENTTDIVLSYTFFESKDALDLQNHVPKIPKSFFQQS